MLLNRVRVVWSGIATGPGVSTFYSNGEGATVPDLAALKTAFELIKTFIPSGIKITYPTGGDKIDETTGALTGAWVTTPPALTTCSGPGSFSAPVGGRVTWNTQTILDRARLQGRTFIVPLTGGSFGTDGRLLQGAVDILNSFGAAVVAGAGDDFMIWHRPLLTAVEGGPSTVTRVGGHGVITSAIADNKPVVLRSRRD